MVCRRHVAEGVVVLFGEEVGPVAGLRIAGEDQLRGGCEGWRFGRCKSERKWSNASRLLGWGRRTGTGSGTRAWSLRRTFPRTSSPPTRVPPCPLNSLTAQPLTLTETSPTRQIVDWHRLALHRSRGLTLRHAGLIANSPLSSRPYRPAQVPSAQQSPATSHQNSQWMLSLCACTPDVYP